MGVKRSGVKTYWHLADQKRIPSRYDLVSAQLHWYPRHGFSIRSPMTEWYQRYQEASPLRISPERFRDPRATTYASYAALMAEREAFVEGLLGGPASPMSDAWLARLDVSLAVLRYPAHALMMLASYFGSMAPCGRITLAASFQAGDEMRRVHGLARRLCNLQASSPELGASARTTWEEDPAWQPLRELVERALVAYDWGESFVVTNLVIKPMFDALTLDAFGRSAEAAGDLRLFGLLRSLAEDARWHRDYSDALVTAAVEEDPKNGDAIEAFAERWRPLAERAKAALQHLFEEAE